MANFLPKEVPCTFFVALWLLVTETHAHPSMCNLDSPDCPLDAFCDSHLLLCSSCQLDVCNQDIPGWEESCIRFCPEYYMSLKTTSPPLAVTVAIDGIKNEVENKDTKKSGLPKWVIPTSVSGATVILGLTISCFLYQRKRWRTINKTPIAHDTSPHDPDGRDTLMLTEATV